MISYWNRLYSELQKIEWRFYKLRKRGRLKNRDFTILASNCNGSFMYYDLGLRCLTPTVNLSMSMDNFDYMSFLNRGFGKTGFGGC